VVIHSAMNTLRNETAVLEHNMRSALPSWHPRRLFVETPSSAHKNADPRAERGNADPRALRGHSRWPEKRARTTQDSTVTFCEEVARIDAGGAHRDEMEPDATLAHVQSHGTIKLEMTGDFLSDVAVAAQQGVIANCDIDAYAVHAHTRAKLELVIDMHSAAVDGDSTTARAIVPYQKGKTLYDFCCNERDSIIVVHTIADATTLDTQDAERPEICRPHTHACHEICASSPLTPTSYAPASLFTCVSSPKACPVPSSGIQSAPRPAATTHDETPPHPALPCVFNAPLNTISGQDSQCELLKIEEREQVIMIPSPSSSTSTSLAQGLAPLVQNRRDQHRFRHTVRMYE
jgi:hypothetical protein